MSVIPFPIKAPKPASEIAFLASAQIAGKAVRFFYPPELPDFPWVSFEDLLVAAGLPRSDRRHFTTQLQTEWPTSYRSAKSKRGSTIAVPHPHAQGIYAFLVSAGRAPEAIQVQYAAASASCMEILTDGFDKDSMFAFLRGALVRSGGLE